MNRKCKRHGPVPRIILKYCTSEPVKSHRWSNNHHIYQQAVVKLAFMTFMSSKWKVMLSKRNGKRVICKSAICIGLKQMKLMDPFQASWDEWTQWPRVQYWSSLHTGIHNYAQINEALWDNKRSFWNYSYFFYLFLLFPISLPSFLSYDRIYIMAPGRIWINVHKPKAYFLHNNSFHFKKLIYLWKVMEQFHYCHNAHLDQPYIGINHREWYRAKFGPTCGTQASASIITLH